jgi:hypothetical protein
MQNIYYNKSNGEFEKYKSSFGLKEILEKKKNKHSPHSKIPPFSSKIPSIYMSPKFYVVKAN